MGGAHYTELVKELFDCISVLFPTRKKFLFFAEGEEGISCSGLQEFSCLRGEKAQFFVDTIEKYAFLLNVDSGDFLIQHSRCFGKKYYHSCYPKNVRRWTERTVSRKKKCRVEFITLIYCHAMEWGKEPISQKNVDCQKHLMKICQNTLQNEGNIHELFPALWFALEKVYREG